MEEGLVVNMSALIRRWDDSGCIPGACVVGEVPPANGAAGRRRRCYFNGWGKRCDKASCHQLCLFELVQARNEMIESMDNAGAHGKIGDEDVPLLCPTHFRAYIGDMGTPLDDLMVFRARPSVPLNVAVRDFGPKASNRALSPSACGENQAIASDTMEGDTVPLLAQLMNANILTHDDAIATLRKHDMPVDYEVVRKREEFSSQELHFLCYIGALYQTRYRVQKRAREFWACAVPALFANKVGRLRISKGRELKSNKYYDKWRNVYEHYKTWRQLLTKSGTSVPANVEELRELIDAVDERSLCGGILSIKPFVEHLFCAFDEFKATYTPIGVVGTQGSVALDYETTPTQDAERITTATEKSESSTSGTSELQRFAVQKNKVWLAQRAHLETRIVELYAETLDKIEAVAERYLRKMDADTIKTIFDLTREVEGDEVAASFLREVRESYFSRATRGTTTAPPERNGKRRSAVPHTRSKAQSSTIPAKARRIVDPAAGDERAASSASSNSSASDAEEQSTTPSTKRARPDYAALKV